MLGFVPDEDDVDGTDIISSTNHFCKVVSVYCVREPTRLPPHLYLNLDDRLDWCS